jgi:hypothetical protein
MFKTKKFFVLSTEFIIGVLFVLMGLALQLPGYFATIIAIMWIVAFASATQDICSDGIYISSLSKARQAAYIGVQGMAWNLGRIVAVSGVVWLAGYFQDDMCVSPKTSWMYALFAAGALMAIHGANSNPATNMPPMVWASFTPDIPDTSPTVMGTTNTMPINWNTVRGSHFGNLRGHRSSHPNTSRTTVPKIMARSTSAGKAVRLPLPRPINTPKAAETAHVKRSRGHAKMRE